MPSEESEKQFERGLARHLRGGSPDAACPDAEILAAYHERTLSPEELEQCKNHIAGCARCQQTLALVESSELAIKEEWHEQIVPASRWNASGNLAGAAILAQKQPAAGGATQVAAIHDERSRKNAAASPRKIFKWAAPAGAIAAGFFLWLGLRHSQEASHYSAAPTATQVAENRNSPTKFSQNEPKAADEGQASKLNMKKLAPVPGDSTAVRKDALPQAATRQTQLAPPSLRMQAPSPRAVGRGAGAYSGIHGAIGQGDSEKQAQSERDEKKLYRANIPSQKNEGNGEGGGSAERVASTPAGGKMADQSAVAGGAGNVNSVGFGEAQSAPAPAKPAPAAAKTQATDKAKEERPASVTETVTVASASPSVDTNSAAQQTTVGSRNKLELDGRNYTSLMAMGPGVAVRVITTPKGEYSWRIGAAGLIERSGDSGKTWKAQNSGVTADLISGTAPKEKTCWVVGKAGTLLLTTDGGKHWKVLNPPAAEDFDRVQASDGKHAKIWSTGNRQVYVTHNAGSSWTLVPQQD